MAQRLRQATALLQRAGQQAAPLYRNAERAVTDQYASLMKTGEQYVVKDKPPSELFQQWMYTSLSRIPKGMEHIKHEQGVLKQKWAQRGELPVAEVGSYLLFAGELYVWYAVGEIVGRGFTISGYSI